MMKKSLVTSFVAGIAVLLAGCGGGGDDKGAADGKKPAADGKVTFTGWGGTGQEAIASAWFKDFTDKSGVKVTQDHPMSADKLKLMVESKSITWDVIQYGLSIPGGVDNNPLLADIDCTVVPCSDFDGKLKVYKQAVPMLSFSYVVAYNKDKYKNGQAPKDYRDFFNTKDFPGLRMVGAATEGWMGLIEAALIADGADPEKLYPLDVPRALKFLDPIKKDLVVMTDDAQCINNVSSGEAVMGMCYNGRSATAIEDGLGVGIAWGQQIIMSNYLHIVKDSPNAANAQKLVAHITSPQHNGDLSKFIAYGAANPKAKAPADSKFAAYLPTAHLGTGDQAPIYPDAKWWATNRGDVIKQVVAWVQR